MTRTDVLMLLQCLVLAVTLGTVVYLVGQKPPRVAPTEPVVIGPEPSPPPEVAPPDAGPIWEWVALERLGDMLGPWRSRDGSVLVSLARGKGLKGVRPEEDAAALPWQLTVQQGLRPRLVCGVYEGVQDGPQPWRLGYCRDPGGLALATRVALLRAPGFEGLRIALGAELDVEIFQVQ